MEEATTDLSNVLVGYYNTFIAYVPRIAIAIIVVALGYLLASWITRIVRSRLVASTDDRIAATFLTGVARILVLFGVLLLALEVAGLGNIAGALLGTLGASTLILGFAFKDIGENFLAGIILAFSRPFSIGDSIEVDSLFGVVRALKFRYTHIKTFDGKDVFIPNADVLSNPLTNYTADGFIRQEFTVGIAYEDDVDAAVKMLDRMLSDHPRVINDPLHASFAAVDELAVSTVNIKVRFWLETENYRREVLEERGNFIREVLEELTVQGFGLPADIQELKLYGTQKGFPVEIVEDKTVKPRT